MRIVNRETCNFRVVGIAALCAALFGGLRSKQPPASHALKPSDLGAKEWQGMGHAFANAPEMKIQQMHTPQDRANYLKSLAKDSSFDPKKHVHFLEGQRRFQIPDVANAAKDLLDRAK